MDDVRPSRSPLSAPAAREGSSPADLDVSIVVPIQDPEARVEDVVRGLGQELDRQGRSWECILIFDGVRGPAFELAQRLGVELGNQLKLIAFQHAFGESVCLSAAAERARGRYIVTSPQYVQVDPVELAPMLAQLDAGADFVTPWRTQRVDPWLNRLQSALFNWVIRRIIPGEFHDLNCYFRAIRRDVLDELTVYGDMYRFLPVIAHRQGFRVAEVQVRHLQEWGRAGFFGVGVYVRRFLDVLGVMFLTKFTLKPLRFFGAVGALLIGLGGFILAWIVVQKFTQDGGVYGRPIFLVALMLVVLGVQIIGFGLVGEIIIYSQARNLREYRVERVYE